MTTNSGKHLEDVSHAHIISLMYKLISSTKDADHLFIGFDRSRDRKRDELTNSKNANGTYHPRIVLEGVFGLVGLQEKATDGLGYKLTLTRNKDDAVIDKDAGIADARINIDQIH